MSLVLKVGAILALFVSTSFLGTWLNIRIPAPMVTTLGTIAGDLWAFNGILPIAALFNTIFVIFSFMLFWFIFKLIWSVLGGGNDIE